MSKVISIRLTDQMNHYIELTKKMRGDLGTGKRIITISTTELIETAIIRLYNETCDYWLQEKEAYTEFTDTIEKMLYDKMDN